MKELIRGVITMGEKLGIIVFAIGFIIALIAILITDERDSLSTFLFIIAIGIMLIGIVFAKQS